jgi:hypothetical protein
MGSRANSSRTSQPLNMTALCSLKSMGTFNPATQYNIPKQPLKKESLKCQLHAKQQNINHRNLPD